MLNSFFAGGQGIFFFRQSEIGHDFQKLYSTWSDGRYSDTAILATGKADVALLLISGQEQAAVQRSRKILYQAPGLQT